MSQPRQAGPLAGGDGSTAVAMPAKGATISLPADVVLSVRDLWIEYWARRGMVKAIGGVCFDLHRGESLALIGESGSGKTTLALALIRLLARAARVPRGHILYQRDGHVTDVLALAPEALRRFRWRDCAMVFQGSQQEMIVSIPGSPPDLIDLSAGCTFHPRCPLFEQGLCDVVVPELTPLCARRAVSCHVAVRASGKDVADGQMVPTGAAW